MDSKKVQVDIIEHTGDFIKVKLSFLEVPITMNQFFFNKRVRSGYFIPLKKQVDRIRNNKKQWKA